MFGFLPICIILVLDRVMYFLFQAKLGYFLQIPEVIYGFTSSRGATK